MYDLHSISFCAQMALGPAGRCIEKNMRIRSTPEFGVNSLAGNIPALKCTPEFRLWQGLINSRAA
jgi:hypothetical protein